MVSAMKWGGGWEPGGEESQVQGFVQVHPPVACRLQAAICWPNVGETHFSLSRPETRDTFGSFLGLELSQAVALSVGLVCLVLHCDAVCIVLAVVALSVRYILHIIWSRAGASEPRSAVGQQMTTDYCSSITSQNSHYGTHILPITMHMPIVLGPRKLTPALLKFRSG